MRIPITMCHGCGGGPRPLDAERFERYFAIARRLGFESISYDDLAAWRFEGAALPGRPIMFDFDHAAVSIRHQIMPVMAAAGYRGNLFVHTEPLEQMHAGPIPAHDERSYMTWDEIGELVAGGWHIGAHTHTHPNLSALAMKDPSGEAIAVELQTNDDLLRRRLGVVPRDFAFTGTSWSSQAYRLVQRRYRFGRLWIIGAMYEADGKAIRYADLVGAPGADEADGGPPAAARYITEQTPPHMLPAMELQELIHDYGAFEAYLTAAL
ncbi:MAG: polysaccharide deacetylase family protein [Planctomycetaceae bacterium]|nr:polysaccharide deacetylase family protein [Planctomycetaceae bacterium]